MAEQQGRPVNGRQPVDLLMDLVTAQAGVLIFDALPRHLGPPHFVLAPPGGVAPCPGRDPPGDAVEPACRRLVPANRRGAACQHEEHRLGGILGIVKITQNAQADACHHRTMTQHQGRERRFGLRVLTPDETIQQLAIRQTAQDPVVKERLKMRADIADRCARHPNVSRRPGHHLQVVSPGRRECCNFLPFSTMGAEFGSLRQAIPEPVEWHLARIRPRVAESRGDQTVSFLEIAMGLVLAAQASGDLAAGALDARLRSEDPAALRATPASWARLDAAPPCFISPR